jgi:phosphoglycolate phosphatase-like HAD superfamily hydrolase
MYASMQLAVKAYPPPIAMATPAAVLFDLDGTLVDTMQTFADVAADVIAKHHGLDRGAARAAYLQTSGIPFFQQLELIAPAHRRNPKAVADFERKKLEATRDVGASDDTVVALRELRARGIRIGVCSNNFQEQVDQFVERCPVTIDVALGFGDGLCKGRPHFERACEQLSCTFDDLVFVGDSLADAEIALDTDIRFVGRLGTFGEADFRRTHPAAPVIGEIDELLNLFA